jgi:hypothetical protein
MPLAASASSKPDAGSTTVHARRREPEVIEPDASAMGAGDTAWTRKVGVVAKVIDREAIGNGAIGKEVRSPVREPVLFAVN